MEKQRQRIEKDLAVLVLYMQGGLSYPDAYQLTNDQMKHLSDAVSDHYEKQNSILNSRTKSR